MKCNEIREMMPDLATGSNAAAPDVNQHLTACGDCAFALEEFRQTMTLLDEWKAPEPSPYFDVRLKARLREETAKPAGWLQWQWLRRPALAASFVVMMAVGVTLYRGHEGGGVAQPGQTIIASGPQISAEPGSAVGDLQALDKNDELYSDFDVLDDLAVQQDVNATP